MYRTDTNKKSGLLLRLARFCLPVAGLCALAFNVLATTDNKETNSAHRDSVYSWGAWEFGLEPEASPDTPSDRVSINRSHKLQFRPNDNAAYKPRSLEIQPVTTISRPPPVPHRPPAPVIPLTPTIRPDGSGPVMPGAIPTAPNRRR